MTLAVIIAVLYCRAYITTDSQVLNNVAFLTLAFAQLFHVFNMSSVHSRFLVNDITKNKFIWYALLICTALIAMVYVIPQMRLVLDLAWMPTKIWTVAIVASLLPLVTIQLYKLFRL
ncbi:magnesium-transporting ATPase (P-type) [Arcicella rosea]|uniref:Magnesium-transporting ATPase (P-type) n=1 Tax=Arcicella rosea TaxID=502909 RepID=A0A841ENB4_9BACT|nr:magnesium-transporting ATPase (P-type) [Arcicella rosea]